jgi:hypothetical protein
MPSSTNASGSSLLPQLHAIDKGTADKLLLADGGSDKTGKWLLRQSTPLGAKEPAECILSVIYHGKPTHHPIIKQGQVYALNKKVTACKTLGELTTFCGKKQKSINWPVPLIHGVARAGSSGPPKATLTNEEKKAQEKVKRAALFASIDTGTMLVVLCSIRW